MLLSATNGSSSSFSQAYYREAAGYYEVVLYHQPEFGPAADRLRTVRCMIVLGEHKLKQQQQQQIELQDRPLQQN